LEEAAQRKKRQKFSETQKKIKRYGLKTNPLTFSELEKLDKEDKYEEKTRSVPKNELGKIEPTEEEKATNEEEILSSEEKNVEDKDEKRINTGKREKSRAVILSHLAKCQGIYKPQKLQG